MCDPPPSHEASHHSRPTSRVSTAPPALPPDIAALIHNYTNSLTETVRAECERAADKQHRKRDHTAQLVALAQVRSVAEHELVKRERESAQRESKLLEAHADRERAGVERQRENAQRMLWKGAVYVPRNLQRVAFVYNAL